MFPHFTPPTDSLYKFMAIFGPLGGITSIVCVHTSGRQVWDRGQVFWRAQAELEESVWRLEAAGAVIPRPAKPLDTASVTEWGSLVANAIRGTAGAAPTETIVGALHTAHVASLALVDFGFEKSKFEQAYSLYGWASALCLLISAFGFELWYRRHQVWEDELLQRQAATQDFASLQAQADYNGL